MGCETLSCLFISSITACLLESSCKHWVSSSWSGDFPTIPWSLRRVAPSREKKLCTWVFVIHSVLVNRRSLESFLAFRMSTATWAWLALHPVLSQSVNRFVRYSLTFCENLTLLLGFLSAQSVFKVEIASMSPESALGFLESDKQLLVSAAVTDENLRAQSLLIASYWFTLLTVCLPKSRCSSSSPNVLNASTHLIMEHLKSGAELSLFLPTSTQGLSSRLWGGS